MLVEEIRALTPYTQEERIEHFIRYIEQHIRQSVLMGKTYYRFKKQEAVQYNLQHLAFADIYRLIQPYFLREGFAITYATDTYTNSIEIKW